MLVDLHDTAKKNVFVFFGYLFFAVLGSQFATINNLAAPIWLASGFAFFSVTVFGTPVLAAVFAASLVKNLAFDQSLLASILVAIGVCLEALVARMVFFRVIKLRSVLIYYSRLVAVCSAAVISSAISASFGTFSLIVTETAAVDQFAMGWLTWYSGDILGNLLLFPLLMNFRSHWRARRPLMIEFTKGFPIFIIATSMFAIFVFYFKMLSFLLLIFPLIVWLLLVGGIPPVLLLTNLVGILCSISLVTNVGPFVSGQKIINLFSCSLFLLTLAGTVLVLISFERVRAIRQNLRFLFLIWLLTFVVTIGFEAYSLRRDAEHFRALAATSKSRLENRIKDYERALQGAAAFYRASDEVTAHDWKTFAEDFGITDMLPGVLGIGFIEALEKRDMQRAMKEFHRLGVQLDGIQDVPDKDLDPSKLSDHFVVKYIEPREENKEVLGLDIGGESRRRQAAEYARDHASPAVISNIQLMQDETKRLGFILLVPVYDRSVKADLTIHRKLHLGWVYIPFIKEEFVNSALGRELQELDIALFEKNSAVPFFKSYKDESPPLNSSMQKQVTVKMAQKEYLLRLIPNSNFQYSRSHIASVASSGCLIIGVMITVVLVNLQLTNRRINQQVKVRTEELLRAQELAESHRAKSVEASRLASLGEMAGGIAHEINNPLSIILAKVFNLKNKLKRGPCSNEDILPYVDKIEQTSYRIAKIVKGMRTLSYDGSQYDFEMFPLKQIIDDVLDICREKFKSKGIELRVDISVNPTVRCRSIQISQVLINLLNNAEHAIEAMRDPWVEVKTFETSDSYGIRVTDSGQGIPAEVVTRMMEPFFTTKEVGKGTGLGLSIAQSIMKEHSGVIEYDGVGSNTSFVLRFHKEAS